MTVLEVPWNWVDDMKVDVKIDVKVWILKRSYWSLNIWIWI